MKKISILAVCLLLLATTVTAVDSFTISGTAYENNIPTPNKVVKVWTYFGYKTTTTDSQGKYSVSFPDYEVKPVTKYINRTYTYNRVGQPYWVGSNYNTFKITTLSNSYVKDWKVCTFPMATQCSGFI